ncbi:hypothetical protein K435DRAFT_857829 [Dendrothele bispora CBS 962.96]|uniref:Uncharacterized protein n=1 Tax=Dendrothele bispora (strain CBS 962.96) TaxID=1314807 RepID=A0A4S8M4S7_DENBC|nr:hypothetical protein K435DRAFT_857829 [Dendrothele bispora CBS 962.96]
MSGCTSDDYASLRENENFSTIACSRQDLHNANERYNSLPTACTSTLSDVDNYLIEVDVDEFCNHYLLHKPSADALDKCLARLREQGHVNAEEAWNDFGVRGNSDSEQETYPLETLARNVGVGIIGIPTPDQAEFGGISRVYTVDYCMYVALSSIQFGSRWYLCSGAALGYSILVMRV